MNGATAQPARAAAGPERYYRRFTFSQRVLHAVIILTFFGLAATGMPLRFSGTAWGQAMARAVGGFTGLLWLHKASALLLTAAFLAHLADVGYRGLVLGQRNLFWGPDSMVPRLKDLRDIRDHFRWFFWRGPRPHFDHFAYWEKFDYWAVFWGMFIIGFSGYAMWFAPWFARVLPGSWLNIALLIHSEEALLAVWFIFAIHYFNTHLRPDSFPMDLVMFTGVEPEAELRERRGDEVQRLLAGAGLGPAQAAPSRALRLTGLVAGWAIILAGFVLLALTLVSFFRGGGG